MKWRHSIELINVHCEGEIGKVIVGGAAEMPGRTMLEKMSYINDTDDRLRRFVTLEPRAGVQMSVNLLLPATRSDADAGFIVLQADRAHPMSGSNCMCVVTALLESGRIPMLEPDTVVRLDTPAGLVVAHANCVAGRCESVSLDSVPAFVELLDARIETPRWGTVRADLAFGGVYYAIVDADQLGMELHPRNARCLAEAGMELKSLIAAQTTVSHPEHPSLNTVAYVMFRKRESATTVTTCTTLPPGRVDRSPCGTGSSANLAVMHARGELGVGGVQYSRSIIGGEFRTEILDVTTVGNRPAVIPRIMGRAWIYGTESLRVDDADPFARGFALSDAWGPQIEKVM
jgi:proline racemase